MQWESKTLEDFRQGILTFISGLTAKHLLVGRGLTAATLTSALELSHIGFWGGTTSSTLSVRQQHLKLESRKLHLKKTQYQILLIFSNRILRARI